MLSQAARILGTTLTLISTTYAQTYTACDPTNGMSVFAPQGDLLLTSLSDLSTNARS